MSVETAFAAIGRAIATALSASPAVCPRVAYQRTRPVGQNEVTAVVVRLVGRSQAARAGTGGGLDWKTPYAIDCYARGSTDDETQELIDDLLARVHERVLADPSIGGRVMGLEVDSVAWDFEAADQTLGAATLVLQALHRTRTGNLAVLF
ncbi:DUF3168 domain-containing protein [Xylophilus sp. Kf1]|nr:DUF3168 domain-containing protein [Xylophilus sp. Kf1]